MSIGRYPIRLLYCQIKQMVIFGALVIRLYLQLSAFKKTVKYYAEKLHEKFGN